MIISGAGKEIQLETIGKNINVNVSANYERKDLSGQSSQTATATAGNKPKKISVSFLIPIEKKEHLTKLFEMAEANDTAGSPIVYTVVEPQCQAAMIRQAIFAGSINSKESRILRVYEVSFNLQEHRSVAEKREEQTDKKKIADTADPDKVTATSADPETLNAAVEAAAN